MSELQPVVVVGDALLDRDLDGPARRLAPDAPVPVVEDPRCTPRPGGAALAAVLLRRDGRRVRLVTALAADDAGEELRDLLRRAGVDVRALPLDGRTPEKVRVRAAGVPLARLDYATVPGRVRVDDPALRAALRGWLEDAAAVLVSDYGRGITAATPVREAVAAVVGRAPVVWDPHPRGAVPVAGARVVTPNVAEARAAVGTADDGDDLAATTRMGRALLHRWDAAAVAVTTGARGAVLIAGDGTPTAVPAPAVDRGDPCGAGDRFAGAVAAALADGALVSEAVVAAVRAASTFVAEGGAASVRIDGAAPAGDAWGRRSGVQSAPASSAARPVATAPRDAADVVAAVRAAGGTVVATGGCFDLLHAGHLRTLEAARSLGSCLVVCLNSDASVRRLKGPFRPVVGQEDRAALLAGLACVDAVAVFDEDTPEALLGRLRPDVWAKGGDYTIADLPEAALLESWGGQAVVLPYLDGHSTTILLQEATRHAST